MSTSNQTARSDASIVPIEGPAQSAQSSGADGFRTAGLGPAHLSSVFAAAPFGANNEQLPERLQSALRRIVQQFGTESESTRRQKIRRIKQAHQFWRGLQYLWWSEHDQNWHLSFEQKLTDGSSIEDLPRYEFVTNIYQAFGLSIVSVLSQDVPRVRFFPSSAQAEEDVSAAKAATEVAQLVERNNRIGNLIVDEAFNLWTDGKVGAYVRFVVDGQRFGFHPETEIAAREVKIGEDVYVCPDCGEETPANISSVGARHAVPERANGNHAPSTTTRSNTNSGINSEKDGSTSPSSIAGHGSAVPLLSEGNAAATCTACGALLTSENFVAAETVTVPSVETRLRVPNGQEVITIVGGLELKTPPWAGEMHEYPYLQWNMEVHQARLRAAYPHAADKIGSPVATGSQEYERLARLAQSQGGPLTEGGDFNINLITIQRTWLRPWAFSRSTINLCATSCCNFFPMVPTLHSQAKPTANRATKIWTTTGASSTRCPVTARAAAPHLATRSSACRSVSIRSRICRLKRTSTAFRQFTPIAKCSISTRCKIKPPSPAHTIPRVPSPANLSPQDFFSPRPPKCRPISPNTPRI
jgi:hypothetical protein